VGTTVAADPRVLRMGSWIKIDGVGWRRVEDTGSAIKGKRLDLYLEDHAKAKRFGVKRLLVVGRK
jgi:3D (Asp-Asp-Asp) domain-containing protein